MTIAHSGHRGITAVRAQMHAATPWPPQPAGALTQAWRNVTLMSFPLSERHNSAVLVDQQGRSYSAPVCTGLRLNADARGRPKLRLLFAAFPCVFRPSPPCEYARCVLMQWRSEDRCALRSSHCALCRGADSPRAVAVLLRFVQERFHR